MPFDHLKKQTKITAKKTKKDVKETYQSPINSQLFLEVVYKAARNITVANTTSLDVVCKNCIKHPALNSRSK